MSQINSPNSVGILYVDYQVVKASVTNKVGNIIKETGKTKNPVYPISIIMI